MTAIREALQELAAFHESQAKHFEPFGAQNALTVFHNKATETCRAALSQEVPQEPIAWLFKAYRPGRRAEWAAVDRDDPIWRDDERWENVERFPLGVMGEGETLRGTPGLPNALLRQGSAG